MAIRETVRTLRDMTAGQAREFIAAVVESLPMDMTANVAQGWIGNKHGLAKALRASLIPAPESLPDDVYRITVDHTLNLKEAISAGRYDWTNGDINDKNFPDTETGKADADMYLVHFNRLISSDDAISELATRGLRPATLRELLAFGAKYPEKQREFPIIELGSVWTHRDGYRFVACLRQFGSERNLGLFWGGLDWSGYCRFAAVRK